MKVSNNMENSQYHGLKRSDTAALVADIKGVSADYVRKVRRGDRSNDEILEAIIEVENGKRCLVESVKHLFPKKQPIQ